MEIKLLSAETHIAPQKGETSPRVELMAALLLARLITKVNEVIADNVQIDSVFCWSKSQVTLCNVHGFFVMDTCKGICEVRPEGLAPKETQHLIVTSSIH